MTPERDLDGAAGRGAGGLVAIFIQRPVLAAVISMLIVLAGLAAAFGVEVRELPDVDQPVVSIDTTYRGATPEAIDAEVTSVIESAVAQVDGVTSISSSSSRDRSRIVAEFSSKVDINVAATDVKNAVSRVMSELPDDVEEPTVVKADSDSDPIMRLNVSSAAVDDAELAALVRDVILPRLQSVEGVAQADSFGDRLTAIRVRIMPASLAARGFGVDDVARLLATASQSGAAGSIRDATQELLIRAETTATTPAQVGALRLDDRTVLSDVALVEWGSENEQSASRVDGARGVGIGIVRQAQSNAVEVAKGVRRAVDDLNLSLPEGVDIAVNSDDTVYIERAIAEVESSLVIATLIVIGVIFVFLRSFRATLIPAIAIPISLAGTLAGLYLAGFSINLLTLLALVMATGLVVDDAIVVTENIERWKQKGVGKRAAAMLATREIVFAVIATTATLAAVFVPISFLPGQAGRLFTEFGFTLAFAVVVSSVVALTLCPMLSIRLGRDAAHAPRKGGAAAGGGFYRSTLSFMLRAPFVPIGAAVIFALGAVALFDRLPRELTPQEDRGRMFMMIAGQEGANFNYLDDKIREIEGRLAPLKESGEISRVISFSGVGGGNRAFVVMTLPDWSEREFSQADVEAKVRPLVSSIPGVQPMIRSGNSLGIRGGGQGLSFAVTGDDYAAIADAAERLSAELQKNPIFADVRPGVRFATPQINVTVDREAAALLGVPISSITTTLAAMSDEFRAGRIFVGDDIVNIYISAGGDPVNDPTDLANLFVKTASGAFVPMSSVARVEETAVAGSLAREQRRRAASVSAQLAEGVKLSDAIAAMRAAAPGVLDATMSTTLLGEARALENASNSVLIVFAFAGLIVLLVLAAQFESFIASLIIMTTVPFGVAAAIYAMQLTGGSFNYYSQIGIILLIGVMAKNGILIVEFANKLRDEGASLHDAALEGALVRLRPVLMTALSTLLGGLPLILGHGAGSEARAALGWVIIGGLGFSTLFTLYLTPVAFVLLARFSKPRATEERRMREELSQAATR